jgi:hypothetical protein
MGSSWGRGAIAALGLGGCLLLSAPEVGAEKHRLRRIGNDSVDLVMSVSWDFETASATDGGRQYLETGLRKFAEQTFQMTEGRLRICKVFVYNKGRNRRDADIFAEPVGRAHATLGALRQSYGQISMFKKIGDHAYDANEFGVVLAHEFGHYGLFLKDEYTEALEPGEGEQPYVGPRVCDVRLITMMGSKSIVDLSMPRDYEEKIYPRWSATDKLANANALGKQDYYRECSKLTDGGADAPKEDATWRTAQWRTYQMSAWELITRGPDRARLAREYRNEPPVERFPSIAEPGMPEKLSAAPKAYDGNCFQAILMEGSFAVLAIDRSQSMATETAIPNTTYFDRAIAAAKTYVGSIPAGTTLAVIQYSSDMTVIVPPTKLDAQNLTQKRAEITATIDALKNTPPAGSTSLDSALIKAFELLVAGAEVGNYQYVLAISDGEVAVSDWNVANFKHLGIPIFTQGVGAYNMGDVLAKVSRQTRGEFKSGQAWQHGMIEDVLQLHEPLGVRTYPKPSANTPLEEPVEVSELDGQTSFRGFWDGDDAVAFELVMPNGTVVTPSSVPSGVTYEQTDAGGIYRVASPALGAWKTRLVPQSVLTGDLHVEVASDSPLGLTLNVAGDGIYPNPWFLRAKLMAPNPVVGASVNAALAKLDPNASEPPVEIALHDDGVAPDEIANDGVYSAPIANVTDDGQYALDVVANNPGGARVDSAAVGEEGDAEPSVPLSAFTRRASHTIEAIAYRTMPQSPAGAIQVRNDLTPVWVTINQPGDVVWLQFNGYARGRYVAMTGNFISNDGNPMSTRLSLHDVDGSTLLAESAEPDGRAWVTLHTPDTDGVYFLKVEHTGNGVGRLQVAVAPEEWFEQEAEKAGGGGDSGGCSLRPARAPGSPLALLALAGAIAIVTGSRRGSSARSGTRR